MRRKMGAEMTWMKNLENLKSLIGQHVLIDWWHDIS
jgi:hypothetical protein